MRTRLPVLSFLGWTFLVWVSRIRNIIEDDKLTSGGQAWRLAAAGVFVAFAVAVFTARRRRSSRATLLLGALAVWTTGWWSIRGVGILLDDNHEAGFKVVHTILMIVSIGLAMWAWSRRDE
jgi:peptidoglycan/LPS O-acetylase OafA/YrhL